MSKLPSPYQELAERIYTPESWDEFDQITEYDVLEKESFFKLQFWAFHMFHKIYLWYFREHMQGS